MTTSKLARRAAPSAIERHVGSLIRGMVSNAVEQNRMKARRAALKLIRENGELSRRAMLDEVIEDQAREVALYGAIKLDDGWGQYVCPSCRNPVKVVQ